MGYSLPGSSVLGFSRQEYWSGLHASSKGSSWPRDWTHVSYIFCTGRQGLPATWEAPEGECSYNKCYRHICLAGPTGLSNWVWGWPWPHIISSFSPLLLDKKQLGSLGHTNPADAILAEVVWWTEKNPGTLGGGCLAGWQASVTKSLYLSL